MKFFTRGLYALILTIFFQTTLIAEYLYKDEVIHNPSFNEEVEKLGKELYDKTGISLRLIMLRELPHNLSIAEYERELLKEFNSPTILLTFSEMNAKVDIMANDISLYEYFNKKQVLSPVASSVQAYIMAMVYAKSWKDFNEMTENSGGTILPLLAGKAKKGQTLGKYSGSMFNGYLDIAEQIATSKNVTLVNAAGNSNKNSILVVKLIFYGIILITIFMYIKRKLFLRRQKIEQE
ncbi:MAG: 3-dehydroquinate dehydratase [Campylobacterota bacterium]|nr:3-dehydroquinate dehydratase [Campylobacterota bacterium]